MIYKLNYTDRETVIADLIAKQVINEDLEYINGTQAVVYLGFLVKIQGTYDVDGLELTPTILDTMYSVDLMSDDEIDFKLNRIYPNNPKHGFAGN